MTDTTTPKGKITTPATPTAIITTTNQITTSTTDTITTTTLTTLTLNNLVDSSFLASD
jgi:hypothetical protein